MFNKKTVRRWQRLILLVKRGHYVGDCNTTGNKDTVIDRQDSSQSYGHSYLSVH